MRWKMVVRRAFVTAVSVSLLMAALPFTQPRTAHAAPPPLPSGQLQFGLSNFDASWMTASGVPWRYRYQYLAGGVYNSWQSWNSGGMFPVYYIQATPSGAIPVFTYYMLLQSHRASSEYDDDYANLNNASLMGAYYSDFTVLMRRINSTGTHTVVHVEPDLWGYLQQHAINGDPQTASVASSGNNDVAAYPNTFAGFGQALVHLRDLYAASTVTMAIHASIWSTKIDVGSSIGNVDAAGEAAKTAAFLNGMGGWDVVFNDVDDHDAGWWEKQGADNQWFTHWWDPTITDASSQYPNFPRYLAWVSALRSGTGRPQIVWQVPEGNQYFLTENNTDGHYQDDVAPYFISHAGALSAAGLIAVLFGAGNPNQSTNEDTKNDGVTNNNGVATVDPGTTAWCNGCNTRVSQYTDDDGGYLRIFVGQYYSTSLPAPRHVPPEPPPFTAPSPVTTSAQAVVAQSPPAAVSSSVPPAPAPPAPASRRGRAPYDPSRLIRGQPL